MPTSAHFSALSSWVLLIARAIDSYGLDSRRLFAEAGLDHFKLRDPVARFPFPAVDRLWRLAAEASGDPAFGLKVASFWHPTTLHALGYAWLASNNLEEAFARAARYTRLVNTAAGGVLHIEKTPYTFAIVVDQRNMDPRPSPSSVDAALSMLLVMCREAYGEQFNPVKMTLRRQNPGCEDRYQALFRCPVVFSQSEDALWLDPESVVEPLATANPELVRINDRVAAEYLAKLDRSDIVTRVRAHLIERLPGGGGDEAQAAAELHLSQRSLQRKLRAEGVSFSELLEDTRRELGRDYVRDTQLSINEISYLLGFTEPGNFSRAFRRWYGKTPSEYRGSARA